MNKQKNGIGWTRPYGRQGWTWNPIGGCFHGCEWHMPNGKTAVCYAKTIAERFTKAYPHGFEHHYFREHKLSEPLRVKTPGGIFLDSMSDIMGAWVSDEQIKRVLDVCQQADWHIFFLLTKNPKRLHNFHFPRNVWVGASSPPDQFMGKLLSAEKKNNMMNKTLHYLSKVDALIRWISFEPLSQNYSTNALAHKGAIQWAVIGAASNGRVHIPPKDKHVADMLLALDAYGVPVFYKGNMRSLPRAAADWRESFPSKRHAGIV